MDAYELNHSLKHKLGPFIRFLGVKTSDEVGGIILKKEVVTPFIFIANTLKRDDDITLMGHWALFYVEKKRIVFFDSFGIRPQVYCKGFSDFLLNNDGYSVVDFGRQIQASDSYKCGMYVLFFTHYCSYNGINKTVDVVNAVFTDVNKKSNDTYVTRYYFTHLNKFKCSQWSNSTRRAVTFKECMMYLNKNKHV